MKKILFIALMMLIPFNVNAKELLIEKGEITSDKEINNELYKLDYKERLYNTYKITKESIGYLENCDIKDNNDIKYEYYFTNEVNGDVYYVSKEDRFSKITGAYLYGLSVNSEISEIEVLSNNKKIDSRVEIDNKVINELSDNDYTNYYGVTRFNDVYIYFDTVDFDKFEIKIYFKNNPYYFINIFADNNNYSNYINKYSLFYTNTNTYNELFNNVDISKNIYKNKRTLYMCYKENKEVLNKYVSEGNNIIEDDYKDVYHYKVYEKVIEEDKEEIVIKPLLTLTTKPIVSTTTKNQIVKSTTKRRTTSVKKRTTTTIIKKDNNMNQIVEVEPLSNTFTEVKDNNKSMFIKSMLVVISFIFISFILLLIYVKQNEEKR